MFNLSVVEAFLSIYYFKRYKGSREELRISCMLRIFLAGWS